MIALALILWLHPSAKSGLIKSTEKGIKDAALYLGEYSANPPAFTTTRADSAYVLRGEEEDIPPAQTEDTRGKLLRQ